MNEKQFEEILESIRAFASKIGRGRSFQTTKKSIYIDRQGELVGVNCKIGKEVSIGDSIIAVFVIIVLFFMKFLIYTTIVGESMCKIADVLMKFQFEVVIEVLDC